MEKLNHNNFQDLNYNDLITGLASEKFKNVVLITGPGIGVPDFKS